MKRAIYLFIVLIAIPMLGVADSHSPLYIVNGKVADEGFDTASAYVDKIEMISGEEAVQRYGLRGSNGVVLVTLKLESLPIFSTEVTLREYISTRITWRDDYLRASVIFRYRVDERGRMEIVEILESTSRRLEKRLAEVISELPQWSAPAMNMGSGVEYFGVERIVLPYRTGGDK